MHAWKKDSKEEGGGLDPCRMHDLATTTATAADLQGRGDIDSRAD